MTPEKRELEDGLNGTDAKKFKDDNESSENSKVSEPEVISLEDNASGSEEKLLSPSGSLVLTGCLQWNYIGRRSGKVSPPKFHYVPKLVKNFTEKVARVISSSSAVHHMIITNKGQVHMLGRNEKGQLGCGDCDERAGIILVEELKDLVIVGGAVGKSHSLFLTDDGQVYACGENKSGQCGIGNTDALVLKPQKIKFEDKKVIKVACGAEFSMLLTDSGHVYSFGLPEYGQLGHNNDGKYFITSTKMSFEFQTTPKKIPLFFECAKGSHPAPVPGVIITDIACGNNHTAVIDTQKRVFTWGFGGYGRLGHAEPKDELVPRLLKFFDRPNGSVNRIFCGGAYTIAESNLGFYLWGLQKRTGEANMYPKPIQDLYGWNVRSVACSATSVVVAADDSVIAWGPSPTYGELGFGEMSKSSTTPKEVKAVDGSHVIEVTASQGTTLMIVRDDTEEDKKLLAKLKEVTV